MSYEEFGEEWQKMIMRKTKKEIIRIFFNNKIELYKSWTKKELLIEILILKKQKYLYI